MRNRIRTHSPIAECIINEVRQLDSKLAAMTAERDRYKIALQVIAVWADNTPPSRPDIEARAMKALRGEVES
jgi:hypothetical protein